MIQSLKIDPLMEISLENLNNNISLIRSIVNNRKILPVVKVNGHGLIEISQSYNP